MISDHIKDVDFRSREQRQAQAIPDFKAWYEHLSEQAYSPTTQAQLQMLSAVLWYLLPKAEYKRLVTSKHDLAATPEDTQASLADELSWI